MKTPNHKPQPRATSLGARARAAYLPRPTAFCLLSTICSLALLAACSSNHGDDLNVIIPKMINDMGPTGNVQSAADLFNASNPDARRIAIAHISGKSWGHEKPYMDAYHVLATSDPDALVRGQALRALGTSYRSDVAPDLLTGLAYDDPIVRRDASAALQDITNPITIDPMLDHLQNDTDYQVRYNVAKALKNYPDNPRILKALAAAIDDKNTAVAHRAFESLKILTGQSLPVEPRPWLEYVQARYPAGS